MRLVSLSNKRTRGSIGSAISIATLLICLLIAGWLTLNRQLVLDQITVWQYKPSNDVVAISNKARFTDHGKFYFYASKPEVDEAVKFNSVCKKREEHSAILGCYAARRIYIYNVANKQLDGIKEVTAAHEMLHAAWDRLSDSERERIGGLLTKVYDRVSTGDLAERMEYYSRTQPGEQANELHSILGTEVADLGEELEQYYSQFFQSRKEIVNLHQNYAAVFGQLEQRAVALEAQMDTLETQINNNIATYNSGVNQLNTDIESFNSRAQSGGFSSQATFNAERARLTDRSSSLEADRNSINAMVDQFNKLRDELISVNGQSEALNRSIDSSLAPAPAI